MKKFIIFGVVLALLVPTLAMSATEFSLGGFIKLDTMWDSDSGVGKNMNGLPSRNNDPNNKHGRLKFTAQGSRFNFTIKGPDLWGAKTSGFIEMDFDAAENGLSAGAAAGAATPGVALNGTSKSYTPRLRHAMFRFNWPTSELMMGQYFSMFCDWWAESAEDGPLQMVGTPTARLAQIRFTQKFLSDWTVAGMIGDPSSASLNTNNTLGPYNAAINNGQSAETPQVQGKIAYAHDFWGKAAYYGKPTPFTVQLTGGWQRNVQRAGAFTTATGPAAFAEQGAVVGTFLSKNQYVDPWLAMASFFIPVIPTQSANLAGTAAILTQWWIGQGVEAFGFTGTSGAKFRFNDVRLINGVANLRYDTELLNKFGGFVEAQYYFNNQWFVNALYGVSKAFSVSRAKWLNPNVFAGSEIALVNANEPQTIQQVNATLWYRPIQAIKFGLQYSYLQANYFQMNTTPNNTPNSSRFGNDHRVEFVGFFYF